MVKNSKLLEKFLESPIARKFEAEEKAKAIEARKEAAAERATLLKELGKIPSNEVAVCDLQKELSRLETESRILKERIAGRIAQNWRRRQELESAIGKVEGDLSESSDPAIDLAVEFFREKHAELLREKPDSDSWAGRINMVTLKREVGARSNGAAIRKALSYCLAAEKQLQDMRVSPTVDFLAIEALKAGLPPIHEYAETTGYKAPEKTGPIPELWALPSDSEMDWKKNRVLREADRLQKK
jgi:hypothetical protein